MSEVTQFKSAGELEEEVRLEQLALTEERRRIKEMEKERERLALETISLNMNDFDNGNQQIPLLKGDRCSNVDNGAEVVPATSTSEKSYSCQVNHCSDFQREDQEMNASGVNDTLKEIADVFVPDTMYISNNDHAKSDNTVKNLKMVSRKVSRNQEKTLKKKNRMLGFVKMLSPNKSPSCAGRL